MAAGTPRLAYRGAGRPSAASQRPIVLYQAVERLPAQIEAVEFGVVPFQFGDEPQGVAVVVEAAEAVQARIERVLAGMPEGRVAEIMAERDRFGQVLVEPKGAGQRAGELRDFYRMGETGAEMIALVVHEHLRLVGKPPERRGMDDAVAVALERVSRRRGRLGRQTAARRAGIGGQWRSGREVLSPASVEISIAVAPARLIFESRPYPRIAT